MEENEMPKTTKQPKFLKNGKLLSGLAILIVIAVGLIVYSNHKNSVPAKITPPPIAKVLITEDGFQPASLEIKAGTVVIWDNQDTQPHRIAANPYGSHSSLPSLDSKSNIDTNGSYRYQFNNVGTVNYHDELNPQQNGTIIVK